MAGSVNKNWQRRSRLAARIAGGEEIFWGGAVCWQGELKDRLWRAGTNGRGPDPTLVPEAFARYDSGGVITELLDRFRRENTSADFYQNMMFLELRFRLPELLLMRVDKIGMSSSIEARVPFLDHELVQFCMNLPMRMRLRDNTGKYLLKRAVRDLLPDEVIDRPKMGFGAPVREWLRGAFGDFARDRLRGGKLGLFDGIMVDRLLDEHVSGKADWSSHLWTLLNLTLWHDHWIEGRSS
jgi:asparagine synthase (glutamine-hydrolysing)